MVTPEVVHSIYYERDRSMRPYGLIHPSEIDAYRAPDIDQCELDRLDINFDALCARTGQGYAEFDNDTVRFDAKHEQDGCWVRSISSFQGYAEDGQEEWHCISRISDYDNGIHLIQVHDYSVSKDGTITEPDVGCCEVQPGTYLDIMKHFRAPEEAVPITKVLSTA